MLGRLIYNYNQLDDARIQQEISRKLYAPVFGGTHVVHAYDGKSAFGYKPYLEDKFIRLKNPGHYQGAADLINAGIKYFSSARIRGLRYVLVTAADTWCLNVRWLQGVVKEMERDGRVIATCSWGQAKYNEKPHGFATDFFILDLEWNRKAKVWPIDLRAFAQTFQDTLTMLYMTVSLERAFQYKYFNYFVAHYKDNAVWNEREKGLRRIVEREPIHRNTRRAQVWPRIGLYTNPYPAEKQRALQKIKTQLGPNAEKLKCANNLAYYNAAFWKVGKHSDPKEPIPAIHRKGR